MTYNLVKHIIEHLAERYDNVISNEAWDVRFVLKSGDRFTVYHTDFADDEIYEKFILERKEISPSEYMDYLLIYTESDTIYIEPDSIERIEFIDVVKE